MTGAALSARTVHVRQSAAGLDLYFPPLRMPQVALCVAVFGSLACALAMVGAAVMLSITSGGSAGLLGAILLAGFVAPFAVFGVVFVALAFYMLFNALRVHVDHHAIDTSRSLFGVVIRRKRIGSDNLDQLEPEIASRHQNVFSSTPIYQLIARDKPRTRRIVVAESLQGEALMQEVKALIDAAVRPPVNRSP